MEKVILTKTNYEKYISEIPKWKIPEQNKKGVIEFFKDYRIGKITNRIPSDDTSQCYILYLKLALEFLNKSTAKLTEKDIDKFSESLLKNKIKTNRNNPYSESIKTKLRRTLSQYLEWKIPKKSSQLIKSLRVKTRQIHKEPEFLTEQEIDKLYKACKNNEERYLICMLFSSGARAGEFFNIRKSDIELPKGNENFVKLTLRGEFSKTKGRTISLYYKNALEAVNDFLEDRIKEGIKPEEPIWKKTLGATCKKLNYFGKVKKHNSYVGKKIIDKVIHFHLFRSSCATWLANRLNHQEMCYYFVWRFSRPKPDIYISRKGLKLKIVDEKITQTELSELQAILKKQNYENKIKNDDIEKLKKKQENMKQFLLKTIAPLLNDTSKTYDVIGDKLEFVDNVLSKRVAVKGGKKK